MHSLALTFSKFTKTHLEVSSQVKIHKVFSNQFRAIGKQIKPLKTFMFMPKVDPKQKRVKGMQNTKTG